MKDLFRQETVSGGGLRCLNARPGTPMVSFYRVQGRAEGGRKGDRPPESDFGGDSPPKNFLGPSVF